MSHSPCSLKDTRKSDEGLASGSVWGRASFPAQLPAATQPCSTMRLFLPVPKIEGGVVDSGWLWAGGLTCPQCPLCTRPPFSLSFLLPPFSSPISFSSPAPCLKTF